MRQNPNTENTSANTLVWRISFDEPVQNVSHQDFQITGATGFTPAFSQISASVYDIIVGGGSITNLNGTVSIAVNPSTDIADASGNALTDFTPTGTNESSFNVSNVAEINLVGNGQNITDGDVSPSVIDHTNFGSAIANSAMVSRTFTIQNTGTSDLVITSAAISGADSGQFSITTSPVGTVTASNSTTIVVAFSPTSLGTKNATLTINSNDADEAAYDFALSGGGVFGPAANIALQSAAFSSGTSRPINGSFGNFFVTVTDAAGNPVQGATVNFSAAVSGGGATATIANASQVTGGDGKNTSNLVTANGIVGSYQVTATVAGSAASVSQTLSNTPTDTTAPRISSIEQIQGSSPTNADEVIWRIRFNETVNNLDLSDFTISGTTAPLSVRTAPVDNPGFGTLIDLRATGGDLAGLNGNVTLGFAAGQNIADTSGNALTDLTPTGINESVVQIINSLPNIRVTGNGTSPFINSGPDLTNGQTATSAADGTDFGNQQVGVRSDRFNFSVGNTVQFSTLVADVSQAIISGPAAADYSVTGSSNLTLSGGATSGFTMRFTPSAVGARNATVTIVSDDPNDNPFTFNVTGNGVAGPPNAVVATSGAPQSQTVGQAFTNPIVATVNDLGGNPVAGVTVNFAVPASGASASLSASSSVTDVNGQASVNATANTVAGTYNVTASAAGLASATFSLTNSAGAVANLVAQSGTPQTAALNNAFGAQLVARVTDGGGNPVSGVTVNFAAPAGAGASATLSAASAVTDANGDAKISATANGVAGTFSVTTSSAGLANVTFTLTNRAGPSVEETQRVISSFMSNRANHILGNQTSLIGFIDGSNNSGGGPLGNLGINGNENGQTFAFSTSRSKILTALNGKAGVYAASRIRSSFSLPDKAKPTTSHRGVKGETGSAVYALDGDVDQLGRSENNQSRKGTYDVWMELYGARSNSGTAESSFWVGYGGAHYFVGENSLIGVMGQLDWSDEVDTTANSKADGRGWMIGPYIAGQVDEQNLFYEARALWGQSNNDVAPNNTFTDRFDTTRWMVSAGLSGNYYWNGFTVTPAINVAYFEEKQESYTDSLGNLISGQTFSTGEVRFGPTLSKSMEMEDGTLFTPTVGISGVWNFDVENNATSQANPIGNDDLRVRIDGGFAITNRDSGTTFKLEGFLDGIGANDYESYGGKARLSIPLR